jgi:hypothetical protein
VDLWVDTNVSERQAAFIFRTDAPHFISEDRESMFLRNVGIYPQVYTSFLPTTPTSVKIQLYALRLLTLRLFALSELSAPHIMLVKAALDFVFVSRTAGV